MLSCTLNICWQMDPVGAWQIHPPCMRPLHEIGTNCDIRVEIHSDWSRQAIHARSHVQKLHQESALDLPVTCKRPRVEKGWPKAGVDEAMALLQLCLHHTTVSSPALGLQYPLQLLQTLHHMFPTGLSSASCWPVATGRQNQLSSARPEAWAYNWAYRIFPSNLPYFFLGKYPFQPGKFLSFRPYYITIGSGPSVSYLYHSS